MSYCRFGEGDVYLLKMQKLVCMSCKLRPEEIRYGKDDVFELRSQAIKHLKEHVASGHSVPKHAFVRLRREIKELGDKISE